MTKVEWSEVVEFEHGALFFKLHIIMIDSQSDKSNYWEKNYKGVAEPEDRVKNLFLRNLHQSASPILKG